MTDRARLLLAVHMRGEERREMFMELQETAAGTRRQQCDGNAVRSDQASARSENVDRCIFTRTHERMRTWGVTPATVCEGRAAI